MTKPFCTSFRFLKKEFRNGSDAAGLILRGKYRSGCVFDENQNGFLNLLQILNNDLLDVYTDGFE